MPSFGVFRKHAAPIILLAAVSAFQVMFNFGRAVGGMGPLAVGTLAAKYSFNIAIGLLASIYVLAVIATAFLIPELKGKEIE